MSLFASFQSNTKHKNPLPEKLVKLLRESRWLFFIACTVYLFLILYTYSKTDPGWSHTSSNLTLYNKGGLIGAWLADVLFYAFGISAYWWVALFGYLVIHHYRYLHPNEETPDRRPLFIALAGFILLLLSSSALEALRFYSLKVELPYLHGGVVGQNLSVILNQGLGFTGTTLILMCSCAIGLSLFTGFSWIGFVERLGLMLESAYFFTRKKWQHWQDYRAGKAALIEREEIVEAERQRSEPAEPIHIENIDLEIPQSIRVQKEKQVPLFKNLPDSMLPPLHLLDAPSSDTGLINNDALEFTSRLIERKLKDFGVEVKVVAAYPGPVITRFEIEPAVGVKGNQIVNLVKDLARALSVVSIRVVETIPGKSCMGLEIPNPKRQIVRLSEILSSEIYNDMSSPLTLALGKDISGKPIVADLAKMPHLLVAGTTGSGKSVAINAMILSLLYKAEPKHIRLILVDPKMLELSVYQDIPHLLAPVVTDMKHAAQVLNWCVGEMERRYKLMSWLGVRNLSGYNHKIADAEKAKQPIADPFTLDAATPLFLETLPSIVVVIDELADLMMVVGKKTEELIARLAQKARASGIHLILATQRPSVDVITGLIKANIPTRIAFQVSSKVDSRTILDQMGAETLLGQGDMLYLPPGTGYPQRVHGAFVADQEVHNVVEYLKSLGEPNYIANILESNESNDELSNFQIEGESDPLYDQAVEIVLKTRRPSISLVQRHLRIGYNRAARLLEQMEQSGLISSMQSNGNREVLVPAGER